MDNEADLEVVLIPQEYSNVSTLKSIAKDFRELRLQALQNEPASFSSSYTTESRRPPSFWTARLQNPQARTFALINRHLRTDPLRDPESVVDRPWLGMLVLLGPKVVDLDAYDNGSTWKAILTENPLIRDKAQPIETRMGFSPVNSALAYHIVAVYVAPEVRRRGFAKELVSSALACMNQDSKGKGCHKGICTVGVAEDIVAARKTYESMGFIAVAEDHYTSGDGRAFHESVMRKDLTF
jgi:ribosomal protein S18 acetylase RimI-like enzyme